MAHAVRAAVPTHHTRGNTPAKPAGGLKAVRDFFGLKLQEMKAEWTNGGLTDGTLTY